MWLHLWHAFLVLVLLVISVVIALAPKGPEVRPNEQRRLR